MKTINQNIFKMFIASAVLLVSSTGVFAQATATGSASATIVAPITISLNTNMNFGFAAISATTPGTIVLDPLGARTSTGGVTLPATVGTVTAASFTVSGASGFTYAITLPTSCIITDAASNTMTVNTFTSLPSGTGTLTGGTSTLTVGATLHLIAGQVSGAYTNAAGVPVTVNYN